MQYATTFEPTAIQQPKKKYPLQKKNNQQQNTIVKRKSFKKFINENYF